MTESSQVKKIGFSKKTLSSRFDLDTNGIKSYGLPTRPFTQKLGYFKYINQYLLLWGGNLPLPITDCLTSEKLANLYTNEMVSAINECLREWHYLLVALAVRMELVRNNFL